MWQGQSGLLLSPLRYKDMLLNLLQATQIRYGLQREARPNSILLTRQIY